MTFIYALIDPETLEPRYVGKSDNPTKRLGYHCSQSKRELSHKAHWIRSLLAKGLRPSIQILEEVDDSTWETAEVRLIAKLKSHGYRLTNGDSGGRGGKRATPEVRARLAKLRQGKQHSVATKQKLSESHIGLTHTDQARQKMSASHKGLKASANTREKMSRAHHGKTHTPETRQKCSDANKGRVFTEEHRKKLSEAAKNRHSVRRMV